MRTTRRLWQPPTGLQLFASPEGEAHPRRPTDVALAIARFLVLLMGRVAEAENRLFHCYAHERLRAEGLTRAELSASVHGITDSVRGLTEPALLYFHRKAFKRALREDFILHLTEATAPPGQTAGELNATIMFVELAEFTPLTKTIGDDTAARVVARFSELV